MFYTIGNKMFMKIEGARAYAYKMVAKTGKAVDITRVTAAGNSDAGRVLRIGTRVYYTPPEGETYVLYKDGSTKK